MKFSEIRVEDRRQLSDETIHNLITLDKLIWKDTFEPYPTPSNDNFEYTIKTEKAKYFYIIAKNDEKILGLLKVELSVKGADKNIPYIEVVVDKQYRKQGLATRLVKYFCANYPFTYEMIEFHVRSDRDSTIDQFFLSIGSDLVYTSRRSASNLKDFDLEEIKQQIKHLEKNLSLKKHYSMKFITDGKFDEAGIKVEDYVKLVEHMKNSMPHEGRKHKPITLDPKEYAKRYEKTKVLKQKSFTWILIDNNIEKPVAFTESWYYLNHPEIVIQGDTGVRTDYRGNKFGLTLKYKMLEFLLTSEITQRASYWTTNNAKSNKYMIAINNELKYKENGIFNVYYLKKDKLFNYINSKKREIIN